MPPGLAYSIRMSYKPPFTDAPVGESRVSVNTVLLQRSPPRPLAYIKHILCIYCLSINAIDIVRRTTDCLHLFSSLYTQSLPFQVLYDILNRVLTTDSPHIEQDNDLTMTVKECFQTPKLLENEIVIVAMLRHISVWRQRQPDRTWLRHHVVRRGTDLCRHLQVLLRSRTSDSIAAML